MNIIAKVYNRTPKENSKTQLKKKAEKKPEFVKCSVCGLSGTTLYKKNGKWFCKSCKPTEEKE